MGKMGRIKQALQPSKMLMQQEVKWIN